ncbi:TetR/AcrR family transcriptional regulator [Isoptericola jiangsuensis]|uniref:TetR/AcrR family transcriptional regulator n=1 Tax=Isoptericola jiangsuensis TaxID=548579 RepID=UPI003AB05810
MTSTTDRETLRDRTRRAVRSELIDAAQKLFSELGFEAVTVDQIAAAAGMSRRSFFRYFSSKEEVVLGKVDRHGEAFVRALSERPDDEPAWVALRRMFDDAVAYGSDPALGQHAAEMDRVIQSSETLRTGYLQRMQHAQDLVAEELRRREERRGTTGWGDVDAAALVAAAFAALLTSHAHSQASGAAFATTLDEALAAIARESNANGEA